MKEIQKISIIGSGCVAHFFGNEMKRKGFDILEIISRTEEKAKPLAEMLGAKLNVNQFDKIDPTADLYILSVKDDAIMELRKRIPLSDQLIVHTSGSVSSEVFKKTSSRFGIFYTLQTISKDQKIQIDEVPIFVSGNNDESEQILLNFAQKLSNKTAILSDEKRLIVHMAAVFASNFPNYLLKISSEILERENLDFQILKPLVDETMKKAFDLSPAKAQTGPAKRGDCGITDKHKSLLKDKSQKKLYALISDMIREDYKRIT
jgi:predicted short-subunit dehydrogenase-like oxidoreductase (DUF2520 family)